MQPGDSFAGRRYQITRRLGQGGFGQVYEARDTLLGRDVALKVVGSPSPEQRERFLREAQAVARLDHPHIVRIWDVGVDADTLFIVQELLRGAPLDAVIRQRSPLPPKVALEILLQVGDALAFAHGAGVVHRDVKPGNIFVLEPLSARLLDFGIAKVSDQSNLTQNAAIGTPYYAAPEQLLGTPVDLRADIYAFGAVAFEVWSGQRMVQGPGDIYSTIQKVLNEPARSLADAAPDAPPVLVDLVARALAKTADERPASMHEVLESLRQLRREFPGPVTDVEWPPLAAAAPAAPATSPGFAPSTPPVAPVRPLPESDWGAGTVIGPVLVPGAVPPPQPSPPRPAWSPDDPLSSTIVDAGLPANTRVGKYTVHELVARGQTGHLYKAFDPVRSTLIGLKVVRNPSGLAVQRLLRASRIWLDLHHPNLQRILEVDPGHETGTAVIATELIEGVDLTALLARRQLSLTEKIEIAIQVCAALEYMHGAGVVHREIKPKNIVVSEGDLRVKVLDSGLARSSSGSDLSLTRTGMIVGDLRYMAPEQGTGRHDQRSDIYSLGVVLFEMVLERDFSPMAAAALRDTLGAARTVPATLAVALVQALALDPAERFHAVSELADSLRALVPEKRVAPDLSTMVVTVHGIRTHARWQRAFVEVAGRAGLHCLIDRWNFGYFSVLQFLAPWSRQAKVDWFRNTYHDEFGDRVMSPISTERPSVVAHSFGTYILGNALLRYPYLRFNKVLLCGSILPADFPWDVLIDRGQVQAVRNEFGARDVWANFAQRFVPGTGPSGLDGFTVPHDRLEQERFDYSHSEYFEKGHMEARWVPFIKRRVSHITPRERPVTAPRGVFPFGLYLLYGAAIAGLAALVRGLAY